MQEFLLVLIGVIAQHLNLFRTDFSEYNFRLIFYTISLSYLPLLNKIKIHINRLRPHNDYGLTIYFRIINLMLYSLILYFLLNVYDEYSKIKIAILAYYYLQKLITRSFIERRAYLSIKKDLFYNCLKSILKRNCCEDI